MDRKFIPKEITQDTENNDLNIASFDYYNGRDYAKTHNLEHTTSFNKVAAGTHYMVCCGDVMVKVEPTDYPEIKRRLF